ncbi:MAG TPA: 3-oxoacyl-ACP reductase, partial [Microbacteriaceae bacterium]|nr:3-oxoacyl-ACP reductase [Microbacteriaceae bacterium]
ISTGMFAGARGPVLAPIMTPEFVVDRVWAAMLRGDAFVFLPWSVKLSRVLKAVLPTPVFDWLVGGVLGVYASMDRFTGRVPG